MKTPKMKSSPPWFYCYAANYLSNKHYKLMSLEERGLWISIFMECWVNGSVPSENQELAKWLGFDEAKIKVAMTLNLRFFLEEVDGSLISPELEDYREKFLKTRLKQSIGGKDGADKKKDKAAARAKEILQHIPEGQPSSQPKGSLNHFNSNSTNSNQLIEKDIKINKWVDDYERS